MKHDPWLPFEMIGIKGLGGKVRMTSRIVGNTEKETPKRHCYLEVSLNQNFAIADVRTHSCLARRFAVAYLMTLPCPTCV